MQYSTLDVGTLGVGTLDVGTLDEGGEAQRDVFEPEDAKDDERDADALHAAQLRAQG